MASETRIFRRVRRCARLTVAYALSVLILILAALAPIEGDSKLGVIVGVFLVMMVLMLITLISLRVTFGYGGMRAAKAHPRDTSFAA